MRLLLLILFFLSLEVHADQTDNIFRLFEEVSKRVTNLNNQSLRTICQSTLGARATKNEIEACVKFYKPIIDKSKIRIDYFIGYLNYDERVVDGFEKAAFRAFLLRPCVGKDTFCSFKSTPENPEYFYKEMTWANGQKKKFEVYLHNASVSSDDASNRKSNAQKIKSESIRRKFIEAASTSDVLVYSGHSRFGGGPDFFPEKMTAKGTEDVAFYKKNKPGMKDLTEGLSKRDKDHSLFMNIMASCDSKKHFAATLKKEPQGPQNALLSNRSVSDHEAQTSIITTLSMLFAGQCPLRVQLVQQGFSLSALSNGQKKK